VGCMTSTQCWYACSLNLTFSIVASSHAHWLRGYQHQPDKAICGLNRYFIGESERE
jgi:hypothetical protein